MDTYCQNEHRQFEGFAELPKDQGGHGRHRCAGCAFERGRELGRRREEVLNLDLDTLPKSQAGTVRHRSPHAAFALGYLRGVEESYI